MSKVQIFLYFWFYIGWFGIVYLAKNDMGNLSILFALVAFLTLIHFKICGAVSAFKLIVIAAIGFFVDSVMYYLGLVRFLNHSNVLPPIWLFSLWLLFVSVLPFMQRLFNNRYLLAALLAAVMGPLSYYSGVKLSVMEFTSNYTFVIYAAFWGAGFPVFLRYAKSS